MKEMFGKFAVALAAVIVIFSMVDVLSHHQTQVIRSYG